MTSLARSGNAFRRNITRYLCFAAIWLQLFPAAVAAQEVFTISNSYQNLLSNREESGILDRLFIETFDRLDIEMEIVFSATNSSMVDVNAGIIDAEANRIAGMEEEFPNLVKVPEPNMTMEFVAFAVRDYPIDGWESLRGLDVGLVRGWRIFEENTAEFPHVVTVPTEVELFTMLAKDRIDIALYAKLTGYASIRDLGIEGVSHLEPPLASRDMYLYVHERHAHLTDDIARTLRAMKQDGTYQAIVNEGLAEHQTGSDGEGGSAR